MEKENNVEGPALELSEATDGFPRDPEHEDAPGDAGRDLVEAGAYCRAKAIERALQIRKRSVESTRIPLREFVRQSWHVLEPFTPFVDNWHIGLICEYLEAVSSGDILRLVINVPPRHMKSILITVDFPAWEWTFKPSLKFFCGSYVAALSTQHSVACRRLIESDWYQKQWGHICQLMPDQNEKTRYETTSMGSRLAVQVGTGTGASADRVILDDPNNAEEVESDAARERTIDWFRSTASQRLNDAKTSAIIIVMQRLHERDLCGYVLNELGGFTHLCLPAEYEPPTILKLTAGRAQTEIAEANQTPVGDSDDQPAASESGGPMTAAIHAGSPACIKSHDPRTLRGELLWPERWTREYVDLQKRTLGSYRAAGQLQQRPSPAEGGILKRRWWRFWQHSWETHPPVIVRLEDGSFLEQAARELPDSLTGHLQSWDLAFKDTRSSAYVVGQVWAKQGADCFLLDQVRKKLDFPETLRAIESLTKKWPIAGAKLVEDKANGPAVIATLQSKIPGLIPVEPDGSKESRAHAISPFIEAGNVFLPHPSTARWVSELIEEATAFPNGAYADQVDAMTQALKRLLMADDEKFEVGSYFFQPTYEQLLGSGSVSGDGYSSRPPLNIERHLVYPERQCQNCKRIYSPEEEIIWTCPNCNTGRRCVPPPHR